MQSCSDSLSSNFLFVKDTICTIESLCDSIWEAFTEDMACKTFISSRINRGTTGCYSWFTGELCIHNLTFNIPLLVHVIFSVLVFI